MKTDRMADVAKRQGDAYERVPFRMHPRVFEALGANLVTSDIVAIIELVKNSYDAFARNIWIRFTDNPMQIEITDDGLGMTRDVIEDAWCLVATPYKTTNSVVERKDKRRRVVGEKGLGRLAVARLGQKLNMVTQGPGEPCWEVTVDWEQISSGENIEESFAFCREFTDEPSPFNESGTRLRISEIKTTWTEAQVDELKENLARLISPFSEEGDINIYLNGPDDSQTHELRIESREFLSHPKYSIKGSVDTKGNVKGIYNFSPLKGDMIPRTREVTLSWERIREEIEENRRSTVSVDSASCGPFTFEIRAWDIDSNSIGDIVDEFGGGRRNVRNAIRAHKGISVYRDGVLVLPKSESARDWLGLDLRRVSNVGRRLSTSQVVGYVSISAETNPMIEDTSDRERLVACREVYEFEEIIKATVGSLEFHRNDDRTNPDIERPMEDLFANLSGDDLLSTVTSLAGEGASAREVVPLVRGFNSSLESTRKTIQERFVHYSRLAALGTIAANLVHEILNRTSILGNVLDFIRKRHSPLLDKDVDTQLRYADRAIEYLEGLADRFAPLASRSFESGRRRSFLESQINECLAMHEREIQRKGIVCHVPKSETIVAVHPGILDAIILNLVTNAIYWMGEVPMGKRHLYFKLESSSERERIRVWVHDTGPGIDEEDEQKVFWPGVTRKPGGIGMGLTLASEMVEGYRGRMSLKQPGDKGGASFVFDLPLVI